MEHISLCLRKKLESREAKRADKAEMRQVEFLTAGQACKAMCLTLFRFERKNLGQFWILSGWDRSLYLNMSYHSGRRRRRRSHCLCKCKSAVHSIMSLYATDCCDDDDRCTVSGNTGDCSCKRVL